MTWRKRVDEEERRKNRRWSELSSRTRLEVVMRICEVGFLIGTSSEGDLVVAPSRESP